MNLQDNIRYDTLTSKKLSFVEYGGELFRPIVHPESGDTVFIDGVLLPLPKEIAMTSFDTITPCEIKPIGDVRLTSEFIVMPEKLQPLNLTTQSDAMCNDALFLFIGLAVTLYVVKSFDCWVEFGRKCKVLING